MAYPHRLQYSQPGDFALETAASRAKNLTTVAAVVLPLVHGKPDAAIGTEVGAFVLEPVVCGPTRRFADAPGEDTSPGIPNIHSTVLSGKAQNVTDRNLIFTKMFELLNFK